MNIINIIILLTAGIFLTIAIQQTVIWFQNKKSKHYLLFALTSFFTLCTALGELIVLNTSEIEKYAFTMRWFHVPLAGMIISLTWFIHAYMKVEKKTIPYLITALWGIALIFNFSSSSSLTFSELSGLQKINLSESTFYYVPTGTLNNWRHIADLASIVFLIYTLISSIRFFKKGNKERAVVLGGSIVLFILIAGITAPLADIGLIKFPPTISFPFLFIIIAINIQLTRDVVLAKILSNKLINEEKKWADIKQNSELLILETNSNFELTYLNPHFTKTTGYNLNDLSPGGWFEKIVPEETRKKNEAIYEKLTTEFNCHNYNSRIIAKKGNLIDINWTTIGMFDVHEKVSGIIAIGTDITEKIKYFNEIEQLKIQLEKENFILKEELSVSNSSHHLICKSSPSIYVKEKALEVASTDSIVLLEGETGTGKEVFARFIYENSQRPQQPFIKVNCSAIPKELIESELFGHEKGAFTGAGRQRRGLFEQANGGTLFLDEIGELPLEMQPKLLRVLQDGEFKRIGGEKLLKTDVRIITATNRILQQEVKNGNFRKDLFYRINVFPITIPPLKKRKEDIPLFISYFTKLYSEKHNKIINRVSKHTYDSFNKYHWPGNIRELQNIIERAVILAKGDILKTNGLLGEFKETNDHQSLKTSLEEVEKQHILKILKETDWQINGEGGAAQILEINPSTLRSRIKKLKIDKFQN